MHLNSARASPDKLWKRNLSDAAVSSFFVNNKTAACHSSILHHVPGEIHRRTIWYPASLHHTQTPAQDVPGSPVPNQTPVPAPANSQHRPGQVRLPQRDTLRLTKQTGFYLNRTDIKKSVNSFILILD